MKKLMHGLIATVLLTSSSFGQTKADFEKLSIVKSEKIDLSNIILNSFFKATNFNRSNADVNVDDKTIELYTLKNNFKVLKVDINSKFANLVYAFYNKDKNDFIWFFVNNTQSKIEVLSSTRVLLSVFVDSDGYVNMEPVSITNSVFGDCMEAVEKDFTDSLVGYVLWNTTPLPAMTAAVNCEGCARGWFACPPAYVATLPKK
jgi:hypothetical protein